ncbi:hypothetical protein [Nitrososphaera viennensis]|nr:hypothetical protein [Nitrososphaera viennensis]UVS70549.1 hypothetical protein NWT39_07125 [Nitrososphaera viennensis]
MMMSSTTLYLSIALAAILAAGFAVIPAAYAQTGAPAGGKSLDIAITPEWSDDGNAKLNVSFFNPGTTTLHQHQDYDVVIIQNGNEVFRASKQTNQPLLHNVEGTLSVPYKFPQNGQYTVRVELLGLGLPPVPITPEHTDLSISVTPEFPVGALGAVAAAVMTGAVVATRIKKIKKIF